MNRIAWGSFALGAIAVIVFNMFAGNFMAKISGRGDNGN